MAEKPVGLSLVIPAYNESERILKTISSLKKFFKTNPNTEAVFVCDGTDNTEDILRQKLKNLSNIKLVVFGQRQGKGGAVKAGMLASRGKICIFLDADLSTPLSEIKKLADPIEKKKFDVVIGSRGLTTSAIQEAQGQLRELAGKAFGSFSRLVTKLPFKDFQCGFKGFSNTAVQIIFPQQKITSPVFDVEILYIAHKNKLKISEVGVEWTHNHSSRIRYNLYRSLVVFVDLLKIPFYHY